MANNTPAICNDCEAEAQVVLEGGAPRDVVCPGCGISESYSDFQKSVAQQATVYASSRIGKVLEDIARGNKNIKHRPGNVRPRNHKFRVEFSG